MAHLVDRVNSLHDPVLQKLEIAQFDRVVDTVVLQVFIPKTLLWAACWWIWQCLFSNLTVNAVVPATVCRSMSEILHSPVATLNVADLKNYHFDWGLKEKSKLDVDVFFWFQISLFAEEWQQVCIYGVASVVMRHLLHLLQPAAFSWRNSKKWISSALPPLRATLHERVLKKPRSSWLKGGREERRLHEVRLHDEERSCWWDVRCKKSDVTGGIGKSSPYNCPIQKHATQGMFSLKKIL